MGGGRGESGRLDLPICKRKKVLNIGAPVKLLFSSMTICELFLEWSFELRRRMFASYLYIYIYLNTLVWGCIYIYIYIYLYLYVLRMSLFVSAWCCLRFGLHAFIFWMSTVLGFGKISCDSAC